MWLPLQLVLEFLGRSLVWLGVMAAFGAAAALVITAAARRPLRTAWPVTALAGVAGAVMGASLADRFGLPEALVFRVWRREVPLAWAAGGALLGAAAAWAVARFHGARPPETPVPGAAPNPPAAEPADDFTALLSDPATTIAVVGATDDPAKFGGRIYRDLKRKGFRVFAVNPGRDTVDGDPCYPSLADLPEAPTIVNLVVPPAVTLQVLQQCVALGLRRVWVQPGAEDPEAAAFAAQAGLMARIGDCIMVKTGRLPGAPAR